MRTSTLTPIVDALFDGLAEVAPDSMVQYSLLARLAEAHAPGFGPAHRSWRTVVNRWQRREMAERNRVYRNVPGIGYWLLHSDGRVDRAEGIVRLAVRRLALSRSILASTDTGTLSDDHRRRHGRLMAIPMEYLETVAEPPRRKVRTTARRAKRVRKAAPAAAEEKAA